MAQGRAVDAGLLKGELGIVAGLDTDNAALIGRYSAVGKPALNTSPASPVSTTTGVAIMPDGWVVAIGTPHVASGRGRRRGPIEHAGLLPALPSAAGQSADQS